MKKKNIKLLVVLACVLMALGMAGCGKKAYKTFPEKYKLASVDVGGMTADEAKKAMASVLLREHLEAVWIFLLVGMCQAGCRICGTIIHYEYLQTSEHRQIYKRVKTVLYILFNIVSRNDYG